MSNNAPTAGYRETQTDLLSGGPTPDESPKPDMWFLVDLTRPVSVNRDLSRQFLDSGDCLMTLSWI
jgi:hypothetical protein